MRIKFDGLSKKDFLTAAYILADDDRSKEKSLSQETIDSLDSMDDVQYLNGAYIGVTFKDNYIEFGEENELVYMNLLYLMKSRNKEFNEQMKSDFIIDYQYNQYRQEIKKIETEIDKIKKILLSIKHQLNVIDCTITKFPESIDSFTDIINNCVSQHSQLDQALSVYMKLRKEKIARIFQLEGNDIQITK